MKKVLISVLLFTVGLQAFSDDGVKNVAFEIKLGLTRPVIFTEEEPKIGFGLEVRYIFFPEKSLNLVSGLALKNVNYYVDWHPCGFGCDWHDLIYHAYIGSIPILARYSFGKGVKFYFEAGLEGNILPVVRQTATQITYSPREEGESDISRNSQIGADVFTLGINTGVGFNIPIAGKESILGVSYHDLISHRYNDGNRHLCNFSVQLGIIL